MLSQHYADCNSVGLNALSAEEERFHFGIWAINKSPLIIGAAVDPKRLSKTSLDIMSNKEVIAINQDSLAKQAQIARRYTEEQWDIWIGDLSDSRKVMGIANWKNDSQIVTVDLASLGIASAKARDVWAAKDLGVISGVRTLNLTGHQMRLWVLSEIVAATPLSSTSYYHAANAPMSGSARPSVCPRGTCLPTGAKAGQIGANASVTFPNVSANGGRAKRWAFPLSGGNWNESGRLVVEVDRFKNGTSNVVTFGAFGNGTAPDLVGFEILE
jgi:alpha-galactosidase